MSKTENRGGKRENAGRKRNTKKAFQIRCEPENITKIREWIKTNDY